MKIIFVLKFSLLFIIDFIYPLKSTLTLTSTSTSTSTSKSTSSLTTTTKTATSTTTNSGIGLGFGMGMKTSFYNKKKHLGTSLNTLSPKQTLNDVTNKVLSSIKDSQTTSLDSKEKNKIANFKGWVKYFKYQSHEKPIGFFKNTMYNKSKQIPTINSFYAVLSKHSLVLIKDTSNSYQSNEDVLHLENIESVPEDKISSGGITDFGSFNEGYCFQIKVHQPIHTQSESNINHEHIDTLPISQTTNSNSTPQLIWIICSTLREEKDKLMASIRQNKLIIQRNHGDYVFFDKAKGRATFDKSTLEESTKNAETSTTTLTSSMGQTDGVWVVLQDWTECSLQCGTGKSYLQRICVPPKNGGKPCEGQSVLEVDCNTKPCLREVSEEVKQINTEIIAEPIYKQVQFLERPQRYEKCIIKESDLLMNVENTANPFSNSTMIPVRVVMNNRTITAYKSADSESRITTLDIQNTKFYKSEQSKCFVLKETASKYLELCPFGKPASVEWNYDFNLFKNQCQQGARPISEIDLQLEKDLDYKITQAKKAVIKEEEIRLTANRKKEEVEVVEEKASEATLNSGIVLAKEIDLEEKIKLEEEDKLEKEKEIIREQINKEEEKGRMLLQAINKKKEENQYNQNVKTELDEIDSTVKKTNEEVIYKRMKLKYQIKKIRDKARLEKEMLNNQLLEVKTKINDSLAESIKKGNIEECRKGLSNSSDKEIYCLANFNDEKSKELLAQCRSEEFCGICCSNEFPNDDQICLKELCVSGVEGIWVYKTN